MKREILLVALAASVLNGCSLIPTPSHGVKKRAFVVYWPSPRHTTGLRLAVKDNIDMRGVVTSAGSEYLAKNSPPAAQDASCLALARERKVQFVGKANLSEFAISPSGYNEYFGTPKSPLSGWRRLIPGGSSCGSAVAVANGLADVSFGTDTAGSVRVPAACCGMVGLKTTHGLIPLAGVHPIDPKYLDTIGPIGRDIAHTVQGMDLLQRGFAGRFDAAKAAKLNAAQIRIGRLRLKGTDSKIDSAVDEALAKAGFRVVPLDENFRKKWEQATTDGTTIAAAGAWTSNQQYLTNLGVSGRSKSIILVGRLAAGKKYEEAVARQRVWQNALRSVFAKVDFIALPTMQSTPPILPPVLEIGLLEARMLVLQNTVAVNFAGNPALALPVPLGKASVPVTSLQLIGPRQQEAGLLNAGRLVEESLKN